MGSTPIPSSTTEPLYSIANFLWELKEESLEETTIVGNYSKVLRNLEKNCNLRNPDTVLSYLARAMMGLRVKKNEEAISPTLIMNSLLGYVVCFFAR